MLEIITLYDKVLDLRCRQVVPSLENHCYFENPGEQQKQSRKHDRRPTSSISYKHNLRGWLHIELLYSHSIGLLFRPSVLVDRPAMSSSSHSPSPSTEGSAFPWILDHILTYSGSYEIPLRTMYTLNSAPRAQPLPHSLSRSGTPIPPTGFGATPSPTTTQFPEEQRQQAAAEAATAHFKSCLMTQISQLPSQPCSLPPSFITSFVRRCFPFDIATVDFAQALTALDYLRDLETRRRREIASALRRLSIDPSTLGKEGDEISKKYPGVVAWVKAIEDKERKVEALYTQVYIGLRRWVRGPFAIDPRIGADIGAFADPYQRDVSGTFQQSELHRDAQYLVPANHDQPTNATTYFRNSCVAAEWIL